MYSSSSPYQQHGGPSGHGLGPGSYRSTPYSTPSSAQPLPLRSPAGGHAQLPLPPPYLPAPRLPPSPYFYPHSATTAITNHHYHHHHRNNNINNDDNNNLSSPSSQGWPPAAEQRYHGEPSRRMPGYLSSHRGTDPYLDREVVDRREFDARYEDEGAIPVDVGEAAGADADEGHGKIKRKRIQQACKNCSLKRVKCDGSRPCSTCVKNNDECTYGQPKKRGPPKGTTRGGRRSGLTKSASLSERDRMFLGDGYRAYEADADPPPSPGSVVASAGLLALQGRHLVANPDDASNRRRAVSGSYHEGQKRLSSPRQTGSPPSSLSSSSSGYPDALKRAPNLTRKRASSEWERFYSNGRWSEDRMGSKPTPFLQRHRVYEPSQEHRDEHELEHGYEHKDEHELEPPSQWHLAQHKARSSTMHSDGSLDKTSVSQAAPQARYSPAKVRGIADSADAAITSMYRMAASNSSDENGEIGLTTPVIPERIQVRLFAIYWSTIAYHWPMLYKPAFPKVDGVPVMKEEDHPLLFNAMLAIAASTWDKVSDEDADDGENTLSSKQLSAVFLFRAKYHLFRADNKPSLEAIAALIFMSLLEYGNGPLVQSAHYCWSACRMALDMGLHRNSHGQLTHAEDQSRRRVFWLIFTLDKGIAVQLGRTTVLRDAETDCPTPNVDEDDEWQTWQDSDQNAYKKQSASSAVAITGRPVRSSTFLLMGVKMGRILEAIIAHYTVIKEKLDPEHRRPWQETVLALHNRVVDWEESLEDSLRWRPGEPQLPHIFNMQLWSKTFYLLVHRKYIGINSPGAGPGMPNSHHECSKAVEAIVDIIATYEKQYGLRNLVPGFIFCIFMATTVILANTTSPEPSVRQHAQGQLDKCISWLESISETWTSASHHLAIIEKLRSGILGDTNKRPLSKQGEQSGTEQGSASSNDGKEAITPPSNDYVSGKVQAAGFDGDSKEDLVHRVAKGLHPTSFQDRAAGLDTAKHLEMSLAGAASSEGYDAVNTTGPVVPFASSTSPIAATAEDDAALLENFWKTMPLGEDLSRWNDFTDSFVRRNTLGAHSTLSSAAPLSVFGRPVTPQNSSRESK